MRRKANEPSFEHAPLTETVTERAYGRRLPGETLVTAIVKVRKSGYVPPGLTVRSRIDEEIFTASGTATAIDAAGRDPEVVDVSPAKRLRSQ